MQIKVSKCRLKTSKASTEMILVKRQGVLRPDQGQEEEGVRSAFDLSIETIGVAFTHGQNQFYRSTTRSAELHFSVFRCSRFAGNVDDPQPLICFHR